MRRRFLFLIAGIVTLLVVGLVGGSPASAHNTFNDSSPRDGDVLAEAPATWSVTFEKTVPLDSASGSLIDGTGTRFTLPSPQHGIDDRTIVFSLPSGLNGTISARWRLVSSDGHVLSGRVSFTIQAETTLDPPLPVTSDSGSVDESTGVPDPIRAVLRFANFSAIVLFGGLLLTELDIATGALTTRRGRKLSLWAAGLLTAIPTAQFLILADDLRAGRNNLFSAASDALSLTAGGMLLVRILAGVILTSLVVIFARTPIITRSLLVQVGVVAATYLISLAYVSHSRTQEIPWLGVPVDVIHTASTAVWLGGLVVLVLIVIPSVDAANAVTAFNRFGYLAQRAVAIIAITGVIQTTRLHGNPANLFSNSHGLLLIAKLGVVGLMLRFAAANRRTLKNFTESRTNSSRARDQLMRATTIEVLLGLSVLAMTAVLVAVTPG